MFVPGGSGNGGSRRSVTDPYGGIPKELRPDMVHLLMAAALVHANGGFAAGGAYGPLPSPTSDNVVVSRARSLLR
jgi:hypothetical protein